MTNKPNGLYCPICGKPQIVTLSGITCAENHGGAEGLTFEEKSKKIPSEEKKKKSVLDEAKPAELLNSREGWKGRIGLFGPSGSGKTLSATTLPPYFKGIKKPRLLLDYDGRAQTVAGTPDLEVITLFDPSEKPEAWQKLEAVRKELWSLARKGRFPYSVVIEDGATSLGRYCMNWALLLDPKRGLGGAPAQQHYIPQMKNFADHILRMKELPCHYILTGHLEMVEHPDEGAVLFLPKVIGKTARSELAGWFDETYRAYRIPGKEGNVIYYWDTQGGGKYEFFKSTLNNRGKYWKGPIEINFDKPPTGFKHLLEKRFGKEKADENS